MTGITGALAQMLAGRFVVALIEVQPSDPIANFQIRDEDHLPAALVFPRVRVVDGAPQANIAIGVLYRANQWSFSALAEYAARAGDQLGASGAECKAVGEGNSPRCYYTVRLGLGVSSDKKRGEPTRK